MFSGLLHRLRQPEKASNRLRLSAVCQPRTCRLDTARSVFVGVQPLVLAAGERLRDDLLAVAAQNVDAEDGLKTP
jgi:hypothetical protein